MIDRINPLNDFAFKRIFGVEENKDILIDFLNATLKLKEPIENLEILNPYIDKSALDDKLSILDIKAKMQNGELVNIEVQIANKYDIEKKSLFYWGKTYVGQLQTGNKYKELKKTICINILNFNFIAIEEFHTEFHIREDKSNIKLTDDLEIHFIEMNKFEKTELRKDDKLTEWLLFLKDPGNKEMEVIMEKEEKIKKAMTVLDYISQTKQERMLYEDRQRALITYNSNIDGAREEGILKGRLEGKLEGKIEGKLEIARSMLKEGLDINLVSKISGIEIQQLKSLDI
jgi:predicted transposase/invertase (TIGR01784 family)